MKQLVSALMLTFSAPLLMASSTNLYEKALTSFELGRINEAEIHIKNLLKQDKSHVPTRILFAEILIEKGNGNAAEVELNFAKSQGADVDKLDQLFAKAYLLQNKFKAVIEITEPKDRDNLSEANIQFLRGQAYIGLHQKRLADQAFDKSIESNKVNQNAYLGKAQVALSQNKLGKATELVDKALSFYTPSANAWLLRAAVMEKMGRIKQADDAIAQALTIEPDNMLARLNRATSAINNAAYDVAQQDIDFILTTIPNEPRARYLKALIKASLGNKEDSEQLMAEVITTLNAVPDNVMETTPGYYYLAGVTNFDHGNLNDAARYLSAYLKAMPNHYPTARMLASILIEQEDYLKAIQLLNRISLEEENNPNTLTLLGIAYQRLRNFEKSEYFFRQVISLVPNSSLPITDMAKTKILQGKFNEAISSLQATKEDAINRTEIELLLVESYQRSNQLDKAKEIIDSLVKAYPTNVNLHLRLASLVGLQGDISAAKKRFEHVLTIDSENLDAQIHLARIKLAKGDVTETIKTIDLLIDKGEQLDRLYTEKANIYLMQSQPSEALRWFNKAYLANNTDFETLKSIVSIYIENNESAPAIDLVDDYIDRNTNSFAAYDLIGDLFLNDNNNSKAIAAYQQAIKLAVNNKGDAFIKLGKIFLQLGQTLESKRMFNKAIAWNDEFVTPYVELAQIAVNEKNYTDLKNYLRSIEKLSPKTMLAEVLLADYYVRTREMAKAQTLLTKVMSTAPNRRALLTLTHALNETAQFDEAKKQLSAWLIANPNDLLVELAFAQTLVKNNESEPAIRVYNALVQKYPNNSLILNNFASLLTHTGQFDKAIRYAEQAIEGAPRNIHYLDTLAWAYYQSANLDKALATYRDALVIDFSNPMIKYHLALTLEKLGQKSQAIKHLSEILASNHTFSQTEQVKLKLKELTQ